MPRLLLLPSTEVPEASRLLHLGRTDRSEQLAQDARMRFNFSEGQRVGPRSVVQEEAEECSDM